MKAASPSRVITLHISKTQQPVHLVNISRKNPTNTLCVVTEVKILTKRSPISDGRGDRRKFDKGPSRYPAKHVSGRVPELEKNVGRGVSRVEGITVKETSLIKL